MFSYNFILSQCSSQDFQPQIIYTDSTVISSLIIEDAVVDDLSDFLQGVCGIRLFFNHDNVREIVVKLVSPSGQSVDLIGPINPTASTTDNSIWDIEFLACSASPIPDNGFSSTYTNEDNWFSFGGNYIGSYHPNNGCLEDFNQGPVNGLWSLEIYSISSFYEGQLLSFEIDFCDANSICRQCVPDPAVFESINLPNDYCEGDDALLFDFSNLIPNLTDYNHKFYIIQDDLILESQVNPDLRSFEAGEYQICGLSYFDRQSSALPMENSFAALNDLFNSANSPLCAKFSEECYTFNILAFTDTLNIDTTICIGSIYNFNGQDFDTEGQYRSSTSRGQCDTLVLINLKTVELEALISNDSDLLTCDNDKIPLSVGSSTFTPNSSITWKTADGSIEGDINSQTVEATQKGTYWLVLEEGACIDSFAVDIDVDTDLPILEIVPPDTIDCNTPTVDLILNSTPAAISYEWRGPNGYSSTDQNIQVSASGIYTVDVTLANRCTSTISQEVISDFLDPELDIIISNISCERSFAEVELLDPSPNLEYEYHGGILNINSQMIEYQSEGQYTITSTSVTNGCAKDSIFIISSDVQRPVLSFNPIGDIDCANLQVDLTLNTDIPITSYNWTGPAGDLSINANSISVDQPGFYKVVAVAENGCIDSLEQEVVSVITDLPIISLSVDTITCSESTVQIELEVNRNGLTYNWYNDSGFSSTDQDPMVSEAGKYYLEASVSPSCTILDSIIVAENLIEPTIETTAIAITCDNLESQLLILNKESAVNYQWTDPIGNQLLDLEPRVLDPGTYAIQAIGTNGCIAKAIQEVAIDTVSPTAEALAPTPLLCDTKQVNLNGDGSSEGPNFTYAWSTLDGSIIARANTLNVLVGSSGNYELIVTNQENGCTGQASVELQEATTDLSDFMFEKFDPPCSGTSTGSLLVGLVEGGVGPYTYSIDGFNYQVTPEFDMLPAGTYKLSVKDDFGCGFSKDVVLQDGLNISVDLEDSYAINLGDEIEVFSEVNTNGDPIRSIEWTLANQAIASGAERVVVRPLTNSIIEVLISTESGCQDVTTALIEVTKDKDVYVPNAFDPSSFGDNSQFIVYATNAIQEISSINVYDRWGNKVFNTGPYDPKTETITWDGTHRSQNLIPGVYVYLIEVLLIDGEQRKISGDVLIMR